VFQRRDKAILVEKDRDFLEQVRFESSGIKHGAGNVM